MKQDTQSDRKRLAGETLCLDFANTLQSENAPQDDYDGFVAWCQNENALAMEMANKVRDEARLQPEQAARVFRNAVALRKAIYQVFASVAQNRSQNERDLKLLSKTAAQSAKHLRISQTANGFDWQWDHAQPELAFPLWLITRSATDLLTSEQLSRVRQCASEDCGWLFLDKSKNRSRRWCDMSDCGNREKARRSRARKRST